MLTHYDTSMGSELALYDTPHGQCTAPGGVWKVERYCGCVSCMIFFLFPCVCCCPCDEKRIYIAPDGHRWVVHKS